MVLLDTRALFLFSFVSMTNLFLLFHYPAGTSDFAGAGRPATAGYSDHVPEDEYCPPLWLTSYMKLTLFCLRIACSNYFQNFITGIILVASILVGIQTYPSLEDNSILNIADQVLLSPVVFSADCLESIKPDTDYSIYAGMTGTLQIILYIFTLECILKLLAVGLSPWEFIYDSEGWNFWNIFDFIVVLVCYLPLDASMVTVIRLFRLLRVLKVGYT